jgi:hypothetical protein
MPGCETVHGKANKGKPGVGSIELFFGLLYDETLHGFTCRVSFCYAAK